ncbi:Zn(2)-C6 fungal-type domain-containing protein [Fusarium keratoplasticum]|uniref:Zn(2)-C6 fungal-type domain-containing protein n=1 Tax=Fusarium keratoplasticum TaxID=1328300 RepID=A0ACC0QI41_9HYPO|nr:Zn(2)-C6 fungal-type domain-containing protein [Fusarium keratoplasticum]KAI8654665.1 Zn(2)-C6 fungal-type domain-containing protein [Fusarium keratoplasticum]KAI8655522.1 Zn(2)-C6 fungal-type domain-containing protein [Fusarium keratoplasticum]
MPGTPSSTGCEACRRQKKRCDKVQPKCGRCKRLSINCVGNGVKRWKFQSFGVEDQRLTPTPRRSPSNGKTRVASSLVHILGIEDIRYDLRAFGGKLIPDLPQQLGSSPALDACVSAMVALYRSRQYQQSKVDALSKYGEALAATRKSIQDPSEPVVTKMRTVSVMYICHSWLDRKHAEQHREMISHLFREAVEAGKAEDIEPEYFQGLTQLAVLANILNPRFELGPWFWNACKNTGTPRPVRYHQGAFLSLEPTTMAEAAIYIRSPRRYQYQLRCMYNLVQSEKARIRQLVTFATMATMMPKAPPMAMRVLSSYRFAWGLLLGLGSILNHVLRIFDHDLDLLTESHQYVDEAIVLTEQTAPSRPNGAAFTPDYLKMVWASITDSYRSAEIEAILLDYENDVEGAEYLEEALAMKRRLYRMARRETQFQVQTPPEVPMMGCMQDPLDDMRVHDIGAPSECVIL